MPRASSILLAIWSVLLWTGGTVSAQLVQDSVYRAYPFLVRDSNHIKIPGDSTRWQQFLGKWKRVQDGAAEQVQIVHFGGSHVQAGILSGRIRDRLQESLPEDQAGDRGFLFPYTLARTNNPSAYSVAYTGAWTGCRNAVWQHQCEWGVSGISAYTSDPYATVKIAFRDGDRRPFYRVQIFSSPDALTSFRLEPLTAVCPSHEETDYMEGRVSWYFEEPQQDIEFQLIPLCDSIAHPFVLQGLLFRNDRPGFVYHAIGVNGASVPAYLRCKGLGAQLAELAPDLVVFGIGVNDANLPAALFDPYAFEAQYDSLIRVVRKVNPEAALLFLTNNDTYFRKKYANRNAMAVREVMIRLATRYRGVVWDQFGVMGGLGSIQQWQRSGLAQKDRIHFTTAGYRLIGDLLSDALYRSLADLYIPPETD